MWYIIRSCICSMHGWLKINSLLWSRPGRLPYVFMHGIYCWPICVWSGMTNPYENTWLNVSWRRNDSLQQGWGGLKRSAFFWYNKIGQRRISQDFSSNFNIRIHISYNIVYFVIILLWYWKFFSMFVALLMKNTSFQWKSKISCLLFW